MTSVPSQTRAAVLCELGEALRLMTVSIPKLEPGQVLVSVSFAGICGKQLDEIDGKRAEDPYLPHMLGHEGAGVVVDVGPGVGKVERGDHVVMHWMKGSGIDSVTPKFTSNGSVVNAGWITTFSEHTVVSENRITPVPGHLDLAVATLLGCAVTTGLGIVFNDANLKPGESIAVFGVGGVGLNVVQGAALVNAYPIVAIDLHEENLQRAVALGATHTVNASQDDPEPSLMEISGNHGFDASVDATGKADVRQLAYRLTRNTGRAVLAGVPRRDEPLAIDSYPLNLGRQLMGSHGGGTQPDVDIPRYLRLYEMGRLKLDELIAHRYTLEEINRAVDQVRKGTAGRCLISMP